MLIHEIMEYAKKNNKHDSLRFCKVGEPNIVFVMVDAWFGFVKYEVVDGIFLERQLVEFFGSRQEYEILE